MPIRVAYKAISDPRFAFSADTGKGDGPAVGRAVGAVKLQTDAPAADELPAGHGVQAVRPVTLA